MKINAKLFILVFTIIALISTITAFIYNTLSQQLLQDQQSKNLVNSANDFIFAFQDLVYKIDYEFQSVNKRILDQKFNSQLDFIVASDLNGNVKNNGMQINLSSKIYSDVSNVKEFFDYNTNLIIRNSRIDDIDFYYGIEIDHDLLQNLSEKIRAEIALVEQNVVTKISNNDKNQYHLPLLSRFFRELKDKNNFELLYTTLDEYDFSATHYTPLTSLNSNDKLDFIIFNVSKEAAAFKDTMTLVTVVIVVSGILLAIIFLLLFTSKFRIQIQYISNVVKSIADGDMSKKVKIITKDEIGNLGVAFNNMLHEIEKRDIIEKEYADFISLINQNPALDKLGKAALKKIVTTTKVDSGAVYLFEETNLKQLAVYGLSIDNEKNNHFKFFEEATENKEFLEIKFEENKPSIRTGITELKISYLYILPIFYNNQSIAVLELASVNVPKVDVKKYLLRIRDQLAIGFANGKSLNELKNLVNKLQNLNNAYQKQNLEIIEKNEELLKLHSKLKMGAEELEKQTQKAVQSEKIKSQFLANMSHELRTPQNSILGLTELILNDETTSAKTKERLRVVLSNGKKLLNLIENILEYSKFESGNTELKNSWINLSEFLDEVNNFVTPMFWESSCKFIIVAPENFDYKIYTDVKKLEQISYNLIGNASKFTKSGYVKFEVIIRQDDLVISVEDTGIGISDEDKNIIFEEFRQADANLNRKFSGTGLGLAICKRYCDLLNADINVESEEGIGSKFMVSLSNVVKEKIELCNSKNGYEEASDKFRALLISDGKDSKELLKGYLRANNIDLMIKESDEIISQSQDFSSNEIIILDILSCKLNGWQLLAELRSINKRSQSHIIVVNLDEETNYGLYLNIYNYYPKAINKNNIIEAISEYEKREEIKIKKLLTCINDKEFLILKNSLHGHELEIQKYDDIKFFEDNHSKTDMLIVDMNESLINPINIVTKLGNNKKTKSIPIIAFIDDKPSEKVSRDLNNEIIETTLLNCMHPLDVLKNITERIHQIDNSYFINTENRSNEIASIKKHNYSQNYESVNNIKILIVDDDQDTRFTIGEMVESLGFIPIFAHNGFDCLVQLEKVIPDLVLLDIMMPKMDGFQTVKKIRQNPNFNDLNILALTAYAMLSDKEIVEKNGFNGLITKPVNMDQLNRKFSQIFNTVKE